MNLPADDYILLSLVNTKLRDNYGSLSDLCDGEDLEEREVTTRLAALGYSYDPSRNAFIVK